MIRALIVEDERMTRETLRNLVPWSRLGVDEVETARDGVDALEKAGRRMPDLVVCDIRMPRMGGLEFARIVRERNPRCGIIFLSGYSEKAYLKEAIRLQAADYLDKPVNLEEVSAAVERNVRALRDRAGESAEAEHARRVLTDLEPLLREAFAAELVQPGVDLAAIRARHEPRVARAFLAGPLRAVAVELEAAAGRELPDEAHLREVVRGVNEAPRTVGAVAAWQGGRGRIGLLAAGSELISSEKAFERELEGLARALERALGEVRLRLGLGPSLPPEQAAASWAKALAALTGQFYAPAQRFLHPREARPGAGGFRPDDALADRLRALLAAGELDAATAALHELERRARELADPETAGVREAYRRALCVILEEAPGWEPAEVHVEQDRMEAAVQAQRSVDGLAALAEATLRRCFAPSGAAADRRISRIKEYIRANHADPDLLVETIAAEAGLSESYLCTVFKQACGITVKDHLTRVRIERAKDLLRDGRDKLHAVALQVGFRDANYFSTVFKREVGITPREYRERSQR